MSNLPQNWNKWTIAELKDELKDKGLPTKGLKSVLVARLQEHDKKGDSAQNVDATNKDMDVNVKGQGGKMDGEGEELSSNDEAEHLDTNKEDREMNEQNQGEGENQQSEGEGEGENQQNENEGENQQSEDESENQNQQSDDECEDQNQHSEDECEGQNQQIENEVEVQNQQSEDDNQNQLIENEGKGENQQIEDEGEGQNEHIEADGDGQNQEINDNDQTEGDLVEMDGECDDLYDDIAEVLDVSEDEGSLSGEGNQMDNKTDNQWVRQKEGGKNTQSVPEEIVIIIDDEDEEAEEEESQTETTDNSPMPTFKVPQNPQYRPMGQFHIMKWIGHQFHMRSRERTLFVNPVTSKDKLCSLLRDWTPKCSEFHLLFAKDGNGAALLRFVTMETMMKAKTAISELVGPDFVLQMTDLFRLESSVEKAVNVSFKSQDLTIRSIVVQGIPKLTREDEILRFFPEAMLLTRPTKKREFKVELPSEVESHCFIEFSSADSAQAAITNCQNITNIFKKAVVMSMSQYLEEFKIWEKERSRVISVERDYASKMINDEERIEMCFEFRRVDSQLRRVRKQFPGDTSHIEELKTLRTRLWRSLDEDTDLRMMIGKTILPEPEKLMTGYAKGVMRNMTGENVTTTEDMDICEAEETTNMECLPQGGLAQEMVGGNGENEGLKANINKLQPDESGSFTVSVKNDGKFSEKIELLQHFSQYGDIIDTRLTKRKGFVSFGTREEAFRMVTDLFGNKELSVSVPFKQGAGGQKQLDLKAKDPTTPGNIFYQMFVGGSKKTDTATAHQREQEKKMLGDIPVKVTVDNISMDTKMAKLRLFFTRFGPILSIHIDKIKPDKKFLTAVVTFKDAASAFRALAAHNVTLDGNLLMMTSGASVGSSEQPSPEVQDAETIRDRQVLVRELKLNTSENTLKKYFSQFGKVLKTHLFRDADERSRGYALVTYQDESSAEDALRYQKKTNHVVDKKVILVAPQKDSKYNEDIAHRTPAPSLMSINLEKKGKPTEDVTPKSPAKKEVSTLSKEEQSLCDRQVFIRELNLETTKDSMEKYFSTYGAVEKSHIFCSKSGRSKGYAVVTFWDERSVKAALRYQLMRNHILDRKRIAVTPQKGSKHEVKETPTKTASSQKSQEVKTPQKRLSSIPSPVAASLPGSQTNQEISSQGRFDRPPVLPQSTTQLDTRGMTLETQAVPTMFGGMTGDLTQSALNVQPQFSLGIGAAQTLQPQPSSNLGMYPQEVLDPRSSWSNPGMQPAPGIYNDALSMDQSGMPPQASMTSRTYNDDDLGPPRLKQSRLESDIPYRQIEDHSHHMDIRQHQQRESSSANNVATVLKSLHHEISTKMQDINQMANTKTDLSPPLYNNHSRLPPRATVEEPRRSAASAYTEKPVNREFLDPEPYDNRSRLQSRATLEEPLRSVASGYQGKQVKRDFRDPEPYDNRNMLQSRATMEEPRRVAASGYPEKPVSREFMDPEQFDNRSRSRTQAAPRNREFVEREPYSDRSRATMEEPRRAMTSGYAEKQVSREFLDPEPYDHRGRLQSRATLEESRRMASSSYPEKQVNREYLDPDPYNNRSRLQSRASMEEPRRKGASGYPEKQVNRELLDQQLYDDRSRLQSRSTMEDLLRMASGYPEKQVTREVLDRQPYNDQSRLQSRAVIQEPRREEASGFQEKQVNREVLLLLQQEEFLRKETDKQQEVLRQQEIQVLQHQQEELALQKQLIQLQQMKQAALREAMMLRK